MNAPAATEILSFLIADIRGYTSFTQQRGDEAAARLAGTFAGIAREGIEAHGGRLLELRGDEALAVFSSVRASLRCAAELQLVFADEMAWHPELPLRVGIGIDAGEVVPVEGGYRGGALNLAARLCSQAQAGQVLASEGAVHLARAVEGLHIDDWGTAQVKGLAAPVRAFAVHADGVSPAPEFATKADLPVQLDLVTPMMGRDADLRRLAWAWRIARRGAARCAVVRGPSGIGKTRLLSALGELAVRTGGYCHYRSLAAEAGAFAQWWSGLTTPAVVLLDDLDAAENPDEIARLMAESHPRPVLVAIGVDDEIATGEVLRALRRVDPAVELGLAPLSDADVRAVAALYVAADAIPPEVLAGSGGIPRRVHEAVTTWAATTATRRLGALAARAASGRQDLRLVESDLAGPVAALQQVRERARAYRLGPGRHAPEATSAPYKGLASFTAEDAEVYFGRERLVAELVARLAGTRFLAVIGASGSGKSSAVRAGLIPALAAGVLPGSDRWTPVVVRPGEHPLRALDRGLLPNVPKELLSELPDNGSLVVELAHAVPAGRRIVLVVDQFEEVFTTCASEDEREEFLAALQRAVAVFDGGVSVVVSVRSDYYGRAAAWPAFADLVAANSVLVAPMTAEEYRRAIVAPALQTGVTVEPDLVEALVTDVLGEAGALPLLSTALLELWDGRQGRVLTASAHRATGGVRGAVARMAESVYESFGAEEQAEARRVLLRLAGPGEGDAVVRRRVPLSELSTTNPTVTQVLEVMTERRLLTTTDGYVEVAHEALLREWPRFASWLDEDRAGLRLRAHLTAATQGWLAAGRDPSELYRGARLSAALDWAASHALELNDAERQFVDASRADAQQALARQKRTNRRLRGLLMGAVVLLAVAVVAGLAAVVQGHRAERDRRQAQHAAAVAQAHSLGAAAVADPRIDEAMLLATQAVAVDRSPQTEGTLETTLLRAPTLLGSFTYPITVRPQYLTLSPDRKTLAVFGNDASVRFFDASSFRPTYHSIEPVYGLVWSGHYFVALHGSSNGDQWQTVYDANHDMRPVATLQFTKQYLAPSSGFSNSGPFGTPDGHYLFGPWFPINAKTGADGRTYLDRWDLRTGKRREVGLPSIGNLAAAMTGPNQLTLLGENAALTVNATTLRVQSRNPVKLPSGQSLAQLSPDGTDAIYVPRSNPDGFSRLDLTTGAVTPANGSHSAHVAALEYTPDGRRIVTTADDGAIMVWDSRTLNPIQRTTAANGRILGQTVSSDSRTLFTASYDGAILEWDLGQSRRLGRPFSVGLSAEDKYPPPLAAAPDGRAFATAMLGSRTQIISTRTLRPVRTLDTAGVSGLTTALAWSARGTLASAASGGQVKLWQPERSAIAQRSLSAAGGVPVALAFSPDGTRLAVATAEDQPWYHPSPQHGGDLQIFSVASGRLLVNVPWSFDALSLAFAPDGRTVAVGSNTGFGSGETGWIRLVNARTGQIEHDVGVPSGVVSLSFPSTNDLLVGGFDGVLRQVDPRTGSALAHPVLVESGPTFSLAADSANGRFVVTGLLGQASLWNIDSLDQFGTPLPGATGNMGAAAFTQRGHELVVVNDDGTGVLWPMTVSAWEAHACAVARRNLTQEEWRRFAPGQPYRRTCPQYPAGR